nr:hypothetical protein [Tanacetum cinerariifolium]
SELVLLLQAGSTPAASNSAPRKARFLGTKKSAKVMGAGFAEVDRERPHQAHDAVQHQKAADK